MRLVAGDFMMGLRQYIPVLFRSRRVEEPKRNPAEKAVAARGARCARRTRATVRLTALSSWQGGSVAPRCIPRTRSVAPWTSPDALRLLDFRPGRFHQPLDPRPLGDFALPPDPHRPGVCRPGPAAGLSRPCTTSRERSGSCTPGQPWADWMRPGFTPARGDRSGAALTGEILTRRDTRPRPAKAGKLLQKSCLRVRAEEGNLNV